MTTIRGARLVNTALLIAALALPATGLAQDTPASPAPGEAWADWLRTHLAYAETVDVSVSADEPSLLTCGDLSSPDSAFMTYPAQRFEQLKQRLDADPSGFRAACAALEYSAWLSEARVSSPDRERFADITVRVRPAPPGQTAAELLAAAESLGVEASKAGQAIVPVGPVLVSLSVPCSAGDLFVYEVGDLLAAIDAGTPGGAPGETLVYSPCGQMHLDLRPLADIRADAAKTREFWGRPFPAARDELRTPPSK